MLHRGFVAVSAVLTVIVAGMGSSAAQTPAQCAQVYHAGLAQLHAARGDGLSSVFKQMRTADTTLPGRWLFGLPPGLDRNKAANATRPRSVQVCVEEKRTASRTRCVRSETQMRPATEIFFEGATTADEARVIKGLTDFVEGRGAIAEVGNNGRYSWLVQRMAQDLRQYMSQPAHPALCSGGRELGEFYDAQLMPMQKRVQDVRGFEAKARELAVLRVREVLTQKALVPADAAAAVPTVEDKAQMAERAVAVLSGNESAEAMAVLVARATLPDAEAAEIGAQPTAIGRLRRARAAVLDAQNQASGGDGAPARPLAVFEAGKRAFRMIEALAYAEMLGRNYQPFVDLVLKTPPAILASHKSACTCDD